MDKQAMVALVKAPAARSQLRGLRQSIGEFRRHGGQPFRT